MLKMLWYQRQSANKMCSIGIKIPGAINLIIITNLTPQAPLERFLVLVLLTIFTFGIILFYIIIANFGAIWVIVFEMNEFSKTLILPYFSN